MAIRYFNSASWGDTGEPVDLGVIDGVQYWRHGDLSSALAAYEADDIIEPEPGAFLDGNGFQLQTVVVPLQAYLAFDRALTLRGGTYRLRLDGGGERRVSITAACSFVDVDFVRLYASSSQAAERYAFRISGAGASFTRCLFAGLKPYENQPSVYGANSSATTFTDCAFVGNALSDNGIDAAKYSPAVFTFTRCTGAFQVVSGTTCVDCINLRNLTQEQLDAIGFYAPPSVYDAETWTNADWESVDLRLKSTSSYASGGTSVGATDVVYDLAGFPRVSGGALGAYECLPDVDRWEEPFNTSCGFAASRQEPDAPDVYAGASYIWTRTRAAYCIYGSGVAAWRTASTTYQTGGAVAERTSTAFSGATFYADSPGGSTATIRFWASGVRLFTGSFTASFPWRSRALRTPSETYHAAPTASSVCLLTNNQKFLNENKQVAKIYVPGWTTVVLPEFLGATVVAGLNARVLRYPTLTSAIYPTVYAAAFQTCKPFTVVTEYVMTSEYAYAGESILLMARFANSLTNAALTQADVASIRYSCYRRTYQWGRETRTAIAGHANVVVPTSNVFNALVTTDSRWTIDSTGYNFKFEPSTATNPIFPTPGEYVVVVTVTPASGNSFPVVYETTIY